MVLEASTAEKVRQGVLKGFSLRAIVAPGGRNVQDSTIIERLSDLVDCSLVDRLCNPDAVVELFKAHGATARAAVPTFSAGHHGLLERRAATRQVADELAKALSQAWSQRPAESSPDEISKALDSGSDVQRLARQFQAPTGSPLNDDVGAAFRQLARYRDGSF
jgi:hypothetical protein